MEDDTAGGLPRRFLERLERILPAEHSAACLRTFSEPRPVALRVNTLRAEPEELAARLRAAGLSPAPLAFCPGAFTVPADEREALVHGAGWHEGELWIQGASSLVPPLALAPQPGERVLDLCAAPGGKTLHLACLMEGRGELAAVDSVRARTYRLRHNVAAHGAELVRVFLRDGTGVWRVQPEAFDRVLVDAPCSAEARFRAGVPASTAYWSERKIKELSRKQKRLLYSAIHSLRPGGVLVYATCSFAPEENELVVAHLLRSFEGALAVEPIELALERVQPGLTSWDGAELPAELARALRVLPGGALEGFFVCRLRKTRSTEPPVVRERPAPYHRRRGGTRT